MRLPPDSIEFLLDTTSIARLATLGPDGCPHQVPVVFARTPDAELWSPVDGKPKANGEPVRVRNARRNPAASLLLDAYREDWSRLWWIRVDVTLRVVEPRELGEVAAAVACLERKYTSTKRSRSCASR